MLRTLLRSINSLPGRMVVLFAGILAVLLWLLPHAPRQVEEAGPAVHSYSFAISSQGDLVAYCSQQGIELRRRDTGQTLLLAESGWDTILPIRFFADGTKVAAWEYEAVGSEYRCRLKVWNCTTGQLTNRLEGVARTYCFTPDSRRIASVDVDAKLTDQPTATISDVETGSAIFKLQGHVGSIGAIRWSPDGSQIVTSSVDESVLAWDAKTGQQLRRFPHALKGKYYPWIRFSRDGKYLIGWSGDLVSVWIAATGEAVRHAAVPGIGNLLLGDQEDRLVYCRRYQVAWAESWAAWSQNKLPAWCTHWLNWEAHRYDCVEVDLTSGAYRRVLKIPKMTMPIGTVRDASGMESLVTSRAISDTEWVLEWWDVPGSFAWSSAIGWASVVTLVYAAGAMLKRRGRERLAKQI
jgi:hypothetical protein